MRAHIVVDLGFGDAGKGLLTDFLVRHFKAGLVVRYNGGAQAGHNVVTPDGRHHTFSQFGSGSFIPGVRTYLSRHVVIHPAALLVEGDVLSGKGVPDPFARLRMSDRALIITPFHQAANHVREVVRGAARHGSCGVGVGEAVEDAMFDDEHRILAGELDRPDVLRRKLRAIRDRKYEQLDRFCREHGWKTLPPREAEVFEREDLLESWIASLARIDELGLVAPDELLERWLRETEEVVFEGSQGVLLDEDAGFHPFTTWSRCTAANAFQLLRELAPQASVFQIGVMRSYAVRHGPGPFPTETNDLRAVVREHNRHNEWQGDVRYGWFDAVLARYALDITGKLDALAVTHMDMLPHLETWKFCRGYQGAGRLAELADRSHVSGGILTSFHLPASLSLEERTQFTEALSGVTPVLESLEAEEQRVIPQIESLLGQPVGIVSKGPSAGDVRLLQALAS